MSWKVSGNLRHRAHGTLTQHSSHSSSKVCWRSVVVLCTAAQEVSFSVQWYISCLVEVSRCAVYRCTGHFILRSVIVYVSCLVETKGSLWKLQKTDGHFTQSHFPHHSTFCQLSNDFTQWKRWKLFHIKLTELCYHMVLISLRSAA